MKKLILASLVTLLGLSLQAQIVVNPAEELGPIKIMNAVNNRTKATGIMVQGLEIPYSRTHDAAHGNYAMRRVIDIDGIFPDFDADPNDPANYEFIPTDVFLKEMRSSGMEPFYRLGQSIEHQKYKKYGVIPPADYKKWAVICEHVIRHYTEGWADGYNWDIEYWEIWNEADIDAGNDRWKTDPRCWGGTQEEFFKFYTTAAKHLKKCFPGLKIGGPALSGMRWVEPFLAYAEKHKAPLDFFSWHRYAVDPAAYPEKAATVRKMLDDHGFKDTESICNEWNYVTGWASAENEYSADVRQNIKGAAFAAAVMSEAQNAPVDMMMYYDLRHTTTYNGIFDRASGDPLPGYYVFYSWAKLRRLGTQVAVSTGKYSDIWVTAAKNADGKVGLLIARYNNDDNVHVREAVSIKVDGYDMSKAVCHMTNDEKFLFSEVPFICEKGAAVFNVKSNCFLFVEVEK